MAYEHAVLERVGREVSGSGEVSRADDRARGIDQLCLPIDDVGLRAGGICEACHGVGRGKSVTGIEEDEIFSGGAGDALVHGVVEAAVGFGEYFYSVDAIAACDEECGIGRGTVDDDVLKAAIRLSAHAEEGGRENLLGVVSDCDNAK